MKKAQIKLKLKSLKFSFLKLFIKGSKIATIIQYVTVYGFLLLTFGLFDYHIHESSLIQNNLGEVMVSPEYREALHDEFMRSLKKPDSLEITIVKTHTSLVSVTLEKQKIEKKKDSIEEILNRIHHKKEKKEITIDSSSDAKLEHSPQIVKDTAIHSKWTPHIRFKKEGDTVWKIILPKS